MENSRSDDVLIEVAVLSVPGTEDWVAELWDLSPGGRGEMIHVHKSEDGKVTVDMLGQILPIDLVRECLDEAQGELENY
jgi:hypothetical protein